jgi:hypothetical protein
MRVLKVIPSRKLRNKVDGRIASPYGAHPATGAPGNNYSDWEMITVGWTWLNSNGTIGLGRAPAETREEAEAIMTRINSR